MREILRVRGREVGPAEVAQISGWLEAHPEWSRRRLSQEVAREWQWRTPAGELKDIAARDLLNCLEALGRIRLPARQRRGGRQVPRALDWIQGALPLEQTPPVQSLPLSELLPLRCLLAGPGQRERARVARYFGQHHYLGYPDALGQIPYLVRDRHGRDVACLLFGPPCSALRTQSAPAI